MNAPVQRPVALILAAGKGTRLGQDKALVHLDGVPLVARALAIYRAAARVGDMVLVVGPERTLDFAAHGGPGVHIVESKNPERGMIASIRAGLRSPCVGDNDFLIAPADMPFIKPGLVDQLIELFYSREVEIALPHYHGLGGHPGVYAASLKEQFFLHGDSAGAREIIDRHQGTCLRVGVTDPDVCFDIDTLNDLDLAMDASARWAQVEARIEARKKA